MQTRFIRAILAVVFVAGTASASFYVSRKLSTTAGITPNAPESKAHAGVDKGMGNMGGSKPATTSKPAGNYGGGSSTPNSVVKPPSSNNTYTPPKSNNNDGGGSGSSGYVTSAPTTAPVVAPKANPTAAPAATPAPQHFGYVAKPGEYGYNANPKDNLVSGMYRAPDGSLRVIAIAETQKAAGEYFANVQNQVAKLSKNDILSQTGLSDKYNSCGTNTTCLGNVLSDAQKKILETNNVPKEYEKNITEQVKQTAISDAAQTLITKPDAYGSTSVKNVLLALGASTENLDKTVKEIETKQKAYKVFFSPTATLTDIAKATCGGGPACLKEVQKEGREIILKDAKFDLSTVESLKSTLRENQKSDSLVNERINLYVNSNREQQAQAICGDNPYCQQSFKPEMILTDIGLDKNDNAKYNQALEQKKSVDQAKRTNFLSEVIRAEEAKATYVKSNGGSIVGYKAPFAYTIADAKEANKVNDQTSKALAVFVQEKINANKGVLNTLAPDKKNPSNTAASDELARQFAKLIASDPSQLDKYYKTFTDKPAYYQAILDSGLYRVNSTTKEANATLTIVAKDALKNATIKGLTENGKILTDWTKVDNAYKKQVRELACKDDKNLCPPIQARDKALYDQQLANIDAKIANKTTLLQQVYDKNYGNIINSISTSFSNVATIDNPLTKALYPDLVKKAEAEAAKQTNTIKINATGRGTSTATVIPASKEVKDAVANEYVNRRVVETTYTFGAGMGGAMALATVGTGLGASACLATGVFAVGSPACGIAGGVVGGVAAAVANIAPVWGEYTQAEITASQQKWVDRFENLGLSEQNAQTAAGLWQSAYSNQGAASNTVDGLKLGGAVTRKDNSFALYNSIQQTNAQLGVTSQNMSDPNVQATQLTNIIINKDFDALAETENKLAIGNLAVSAITGGISGGAGASVAKSIIAPPPAKTILGNLAKVAGNKFVGGGAALNAGNSVLNIVQAKIQADQTIGYTDTPEEIALQTCLIQNGSSGCDAQQLAVDETNTQIAADQIAMAFWTDTIINVGQEITSGVVEFNALNKSNTNTTNTPTTAYQGDSVLYKQVPGLTEKLASLGITEDILFDRKVPTQTTDSITLANLIKAEAADTTTNNNKNFQNTASSLGNLKNSPTADTSIVQAVVIYRDLPDSEFKVKLKEQGFSANNTDIALQIKQSNRAEILIDYRNKMIEGGATIEAQNTYFETGSKKLVQDAKNAIEASKPKPDPIIALEKGTGNLPDATPVTNSVYIQDLAEITGLPENYINSFSDIEIASLRPAIEEHNNPNTSTTRRAQLAQEINTEVGRLNSLPADERVPQNLPIINPSDQVPNTNTASVDKTTPTTPPPPTLTNSQKNRLTEMFVYELDNLNSKKYTKEEFTEAYDNLISKYQKEGIEFKKPDGTNFGNPTPVGYNDLQIALVRLKNKFISPGTLESPYNQLVILGRPETTPVANATPKSQSWFSKIWNGEGISESGGGGNKNANKSLLGGIIWIKEDAPNTSTPKPSGPASILGVPEKALADLESKLTPAKKQALTDGTNRVNSDKLKVVKQNSDGSVIYSKTSEISGNKNTTYIEVESNLPDTIIINEAQKRGIVTQNKTVKEIQAELIKPKNFLTNIINRLAGLETKPFDPNQILTDSNFYNDHQLVADLLPNSSPAELRVTFKTKEGQQALDRLNSKNIVIENVDADGKVTYIDKGTDLSDPTKTVRRNTRPAEDLDSQVIRQAQKEIRFDPANPTKPYSVVGKTVPEIIADIRTKRTNDTVLVKENHNLPISDELYTFGAKMLPDQIAVALVNTRAENPGSNILTVEIEKGRVWSAKYLDEGYPGWTKISQDIDAQLKATGIPASQIPEIKAKIKEDLITKMKSGVLASNGELVLSPKSANQDTFYDLGVDRSQSISQIANHLETNFIPKLETAITDINKQYNLNLTLDKNHTAKDFVWFGVSQDLKEPIAFHIIDKGPYKEIFNVIPGGSELLNGVFATELYSNLDPKFKTDSNYLPIIEQATPEQIKANQSKSMDLTKKEINIEGHVINRNEVKVYDPKDIKPKTTFTLEESKYLAGFSFESVTSIEKLMASLSPEERVKLGKQIVNVKLNDTTSISINKTNQIANDLAGYSKMTTSIDQVADQATRSRMKNGWLEIEKAIQERFSKKGLTYEHGGDGLRKLIIGELTIEDLAYTVDQSTILKEVFAEATSGNMSPNAAEAANFLTKTHGEDVFTKVGIGTGDSTLNIFPSSQVEVKSSTDVDVLLTNVKRYREQQKSMGKTSPDAMAGISKDIYIRFNDTAERAALNKAGMDIFEEQITNSNGQKETAFFIKRTTPIADVDSSINTQVAGPRSTRQSPPTPDVTSPSNPVKSVGLQIAEYLDENISKAITLQELNGIPSKVQNPITPDPLTGTLTIEKLRQVLPDTPRDITGGLTGEARSLDRINDPNRKVIGFDGKRVTYNDTIGTGNPIEIHILTEATKLGIEVDTPNIADAKSMPQILKEIQATKQNSSTTRATDPQSNTHPLVALRERIREPFSTTPTTPESTTPVLKAGKNIPNTTDNKSIKVTTIEQSSRFGTDALTAEYLRELSTIKAGADESIKYKLKKDPEYDPQPLLNFYSNQTTDLKTKYSEMGLSFKEGTDTPIGVPDTKIRIQKIINTIQVLRNLLVGTPSTSEPARTTPQPRPQPVRPLSDEAYWLSQEGKSRTPRPTKKEIATPLKTATKNLLYRNENGTLMVAISEANRIRFFLTTGIVSGASAVAATILKILTINGYAKLNANKIAPLISPTPTAIISITPSPTKLISPTVTISIAPTITPSPTTEPRYNYSYTNDSIYSSNPELNNALRGKGLLLNSQSFDPNSTDPNIKHMYEAAKLAEIIRSYSGPVDDSESSKVAFWHYLNSSVSKEIPSLLERQFTSVKYVDGVKYTNTLNFENYFNTNFLDGEFGSYAKDTKTYEKVQCVSWGQTIGQLIMRENEQPAQFVDYDKGNGGLFPGSIFNSRNDVVKIQNPKITDPQPGDIYINNVINGEEKHTGTYVGTYIVNGERYFAISESNSRKEAVTEDGKPKSLGNPYLYLVNEDGLKNLVGLEGTTIIRNPDQKIIPPLTDDQIPQDIKDAISAIKNAK